MNSAYPYTRWSIKRDSKLTLLTLANLDYFSIFFAPRQPEINLQQNTVIYL